MNLEIVRAVEKIQMIDLLDEIARDEFYYTKDGKTYWIYKE